MKRRFITLADVVFTFAVCAAAVPFLALLGVLSLGEALRRRLVRSWRRA